MALGELTKQLAEQAIRTVTAPPAPPSPADQMGATLMAQVQAMQKALKEDEELVVLYQAGAESVRVFEFFFPSWQLVVLIGVDKDRAKTRVISPVETLQLICKVSKVAAGGKPARISLVAPKG